jgi:hypothetical protein
MYAIIAGYAINAVLTEYKEISKAVVRNDMDTFLLYRDEQLPILIHVFLGTISLYIIIFTMLFPFNDVKLGASAVFVVSSLVVMAYVIVSELDDYQKSIWFKEKIPPEWYEVDINEHFNKKAEKII